MGSCDRSRWVKHESWQQEQFSLAYVRAVATVAGFSTALPGVDHDGVDLTVCSRSSTGIVRSPKLDVQVKSECSGQPAKFPWQYALKVGNYEALRPTNYVTPRILVVVALPSDLSNWLGQSPKQLTLRHCAYWVSLRGQPVSKNTSTVTVSLPRSQVFSPKELEAMMTRIGDEQEP
jgi:hypothetical protein